MDAGENEVQHFSETLASRVAWLVVLLIVLLKCIKPHQWNDRRIGVEVLHQIPRSYARAAP